MKFENGVGVLIGIPTLGRPVNLPWAFAFRAQTPTINYNAQVMTVWGRPVAEAREMTCEEALRRNCRYVYFIGDDTVPPNHALRQLIYRMEQDPQLGVVGGIYCSKSDPPSPLVFRGNGQGSYWDWKVGEYFECSGLGMDCTLIRVDALKQMSRPWFKTIDDNAFLKGENYVEQWTEDLYFCDKLVRETPFKICADAGVIAEHWDVANNRMFTLPANSLPLRKIAATPGKRALDVGSGELERTFEDCETVVRVDIREEAKPDYRCDVRFLPFGDEEFDIVFSSHVLEHIDRGQQKSTLEEWCRVVKKGGELRLVLPSIKWAAQEIVKGNLDYNVLNVLYGAQSNPYDYHQAGFTPEFLRELVTSLGLSVTEVREEGYNILLSAIK